MKSVSILSVILLLGTVALSAPAILDDSTRETIAKSLDPKLEAFDRDDDGALGEIERKAVLAMVAKRYGERWVALARIAFREADRDGNGSLSGAEWDRWAKPHLGRSVESRKQTIALPMSDGVKLATDVYLPNGEGPWPVILMRTPYNRKRANAVPWTANGYVLVMQDQRGRFESEGENLPFVGCGGDGRDTLAWVTEQDWCDGRVGTLGGSALGITQNLLAAADPGPALRAQYISVAAASLYHDAVFVGGALRKSQIEVWVRTNRYAPETIPTFKAHPDYDELWKPFDTTLAHRSMEAPALHWGGWFDTFCLGTLTSFLGRQRHGAEGARGRQNLVLGPWAHASRRGGKVGDLVFPNSTFPRAYTARPWFDHHLKGKKNGVEMRPAVAYYVMGESGKEGGPGNEWRFADAWPIPHTPTELFLGADGRLVGEAGQSEEAHLEYVFDPKRPCPTNGGCNLVIPAGPRDQSRAERREDVLVFTTPALEEPLEVTGRAKAVLYLSSSAVDTDLSVRLTDVYPDGRSYLFAEGMLRARYREGFDKPKPLTPGEVVRFEVELWPTSIVFDRGHRIRVAVTSSNHPRFDVNPGTGKTISEGGKMVEQRNRLYCGGQRASSIILPVAR